MTPRMPNIPKNARFRGRVCKVPETELEDATIRGPIGNQSCYAKYDSGSTCPQWKSKRNVRLDDGQVTWLFEHLFACSARIDEGEIDTMRAFVGILDALEAGAMGQLQDNIRFVIAQLRGRIEGESDGTEDDATTGGDLPGFDKRKPNVCKASGDKECHTCKSLGFTCPICDPTQHFLFEDAVEALAVEDPTEWSIFCEGTEVEAVDGLTWEFELFAERGEDRMRWEVAEDGTRTHVHGGEWVASGADDRCHNCGSANIEVYCRDCDQLAVKAEV